MFAVFLARSIESLIKCVYTRRVILRENHFAAMPSSVTPAIITRLRTVLLFWEDLGVFTCTYYLLMAFFRITTFFTFLLNRWNFLNFSASLSFSLSSMFSISNALSLSSLASVFELGVWSYCPEIAALKALTFGVLYSMWCTKNARRLILALTWPYTDLFWP